MTSSTFFNGIELRWLIEKEVPFDKVLQYRERHHYVDNFRGISELRYTPWEDVPTILESEL